MRVRLHARVFTYTSYPERAEPCKESYSESLILIQSVHNHYIPKHTPTYVHNNAYDMSTCIQILQLLQHYYVYIV